MVVSTWGGGAPHDRRWLRCVKWRRWHRSLFKAVLCKADSGQMLGDPLLRLPNGSPLPKENDNYRSSPSTTRHAEAKEFRTAGISQRSQ